MPHRNDMQGGAFSFEVRGERPDRVVKAAVERWQRLRRPRAGMLFVSGHLVEHLPDIAASLASALDRLTSADRSPAPRWLLAAGAGVLTERGELERRTAAAGLVLQGGAPLGVASGPRPEGFVDRLADALEGHRSATAFVMARADRFEEEMLESLTTAQRPGLGARIFGGGSVPEQDVFLVGPGSVQAGAAAALLFSGFTPARIIASPAGKLLGPFQPVTKLRASMVLEIGGERALDVLSASTKGLEDPGLVLLAVAAPPLLPEPAPRELSSWIPPPPATPPVVLRAIQGVDPGHGSVLVGDGVPLGARVAFAVRDAASARQRLSDQLQQLARSSAGSAPRFGVYVNCAGRGSGLYGAHDVDVKLLRARFEDLPLVGLHTAFELAPFGERAALQLYTGVLGLFCAPS